MILLVFLEIDEEKRSPMMGSRKKGQQRTEKVSQETWVVRWFGENDSYSFPEVYGSGGGSRIVVVHYSTRREEDFPEEMTQSRPKENE